MATGTLSLILPVAASGVKLALDETAYNAIEEQLDFGKSVIDAVIGEGTKIEEMNKRQEFLWVHPRFEKEY